MNVAFKIARSLIGCILILVIITFLTFFLSFISPSDPAEIKLGKVGIVPSAKLLEETREAMGLNRPFYAQYGSWAGGVLQGDFGDSYRTGETVAFEINKALPKTLILSALTMGVIIITAIPIGIICGGRRGGIFDKIIQGVTYFFVSIPSFVLGLGLLFLFSVKFNWLSVSPNQGLSGYIMPAIVLIATLGSWYIRQIRAIILNQYSREYVEGLRAKGLAEKTILIKHILKNSMVPIITLMGNSLAILLAGTAIVENIFSIQGIGYLAVESVSARDYPVIQGFVFWAALIFIVINTIIDFAYPIIDPRIKSGKLTGIE